MIKRVSISVTPSCPRVLCDPPSHSSPPPVSRQPLVAACSEGESETRLKGLLLGAARLPGGVALTQVLRLWKWTVPSLPEVKQTLAHLQVGVLERERDDTKCRSLQENISA